MTKGQQGKELADIEGMVKAGSPAISEDGKSVMDAALYRDGMLEAARLGIPVLAHCEDIHMVRGGVMNADAKAKELGGKIEIVSFVRFEKGEGIEKRADDFASEVASMMK